MKCIPIFSLVLLAFPGAVLADDKSPAPTRHALLVGCSKYANLPLGKHLQGPSNDVILVREMLGKRFQFADQNVVTLSDEAGEASDDLRPMRANIHKQFKRLAQAAKKGDLVYIHLSGHGAQQPQKDLDDPESYEPDGLSEIFLPADIGAWEDDKQGVANAIVDTELRAWLKAIRAKGASLVVVVDTCHSGTILRKHEEVLREVRMDELKIPSLALVEARKKAKKVAEKWADKLGPKIRGADEALARLSNHVPDLVAIYAARPFEPTIEDRFPRDSPAAKRYGLLTFTMVQVLTESPRPLTYLEVAQKIDARYRQMGRNGPVPGVEGKDRDQEFLGQKSWPGRSRILLAKTKDGWNVNAGALQGLTEGSILTVYPAADEEIKIGHVEVRGLDALEAAVRPCAFAGMPKKLDLPEGGNCKLTHVNFGAERLRVAVDPGKKDAPLREVLQRIDKAAHSLIHQVDQPEQADWILRATKAGVTLVPAGAGAAAHMRGAGDDTNPFFPFDDDLPKGVETAFQRIARARNLIKLSAAMQQDQALEADQAYAPKVQLDLLRFRGKETVKVSWGTHGMVMRAGDILAFEFTNKGKEAVDVSLLFVDSSFGITAIFPQPGTETDNRLPPGKSLRTPKARINNKSFGTEHVVLIAVRSKAERPIDFSCLEQPSLESARAKTRGQEDQPLDNPLGKLFQTGLYGAGTDRGMDRVEYRNYSTQVLSWTTAPQEP